MSGGDYLGGAILLAAMFAGTFGGAWILLRRRYPGLRGTEALAAFGLLATLGVLAVHLLPATFGLLGRGSVLVLSGLWLAGCLLVRQTPSVPEDRRPPPRDAYARFSWPIALAGAALVALMFVAFARDQLIVTPTGVDFTSFHMPNVARWIQTGSIWQIDNFLPYVALGNYPNTGDAMLLAFVLPWHNDFLAHFAIWPFYLLTGVATYALALRLGAERSAAVIAAAVVLAIPAVAVSALPVTLVDAVMLFGFATGLLFLIRHHETGRTADLVLAGLALGISFGTKWYAVWAVAIVVAVWGVARLLAGRGWRQALGQGAVLSGLIAMSGGIWLVRNWVESGNPVFPVKVAPFGVTLFDAPRDVVREAGGFTILHYLDQPDVWREYILPQYEYALAAPAALALVGGLLATVLLVRNRGARRGVLYAAAASAGLLLLAYTATPYTAGGQEGVPLLVAADSRYAIPALLVAAALAGAVASRFPWGALAFSALGLAAVVHGVRWSTNGDLGTARLTFRDWVAAVMLAAALAGLILLLRHLRAAGRRGPAGAVLVAMLVGVGVAGHQVQESYNDDRYLRSDAALDELARRAPSGHRIGLTAVWTEAGLAPILPAFGPRFGNEVEYVGPLVRELQQRYEDRDAFVAALAEGDYDYLVVGTGRPGLPDPDEDEWARSAGWTPIAASDRLELFAAPAPPGSAELTPGPRPPA